MRPLSLVWLLPLAAVSVGCDPPNSLGGSIGVDLAFDETRMIRYESLDIQLEYLKRLEAGGHDIVAKIVFSTPEGGIAAGEEIDLVANNGVVERIVARGDGFPGLESGTITFEEGGNAPGPAKGKFDVVFTNGRSLYGRFEVEMEDVAF